MNILFCTVADDRYTDGLLVMLYSLQKHYKDFKSHDLKIYHNPQVSSLSESNQKKISTICKHAQFVEISINENELKNIFTKRDAYQATYLFFQPFRENGYDRVVVFDSDMLCRSDFSSLVCNLEFDGIAGVTEYEPSPTFFWLNRLFRKSFKRTMLDTDKDRPYHLSLLEVFLGNRLNFENTIKRPIKSFLNRFFLTRSLSIYPRDPINTGFFILSKSMTNKRWSIELERTAEIFLEKFDENQELLGDQPIINWLKHNHCIKTVRLSYTMNTTSPLLTFYPESELKKSAIFHFTGSHKPWIEGQKESRYQDNFAYKEWKKYKYEMMEKFN